MPDEEDVPEMSDETAPPTPEEPEVPEVVEDTPPPPDAPVLPDVPDEEDPVLVDEAPEPSPEDPVVPAPEEPELVMDPVDHIPEDPEPIEDPQPEIIEETPDFEFVWGNGCSNRLRGSEDNEVFVSGAGRRDKIWTGEGEDIVFIGGEASNGWRDRDVLVDFDAEMDAIALAEGIEVVDHWHNRKDHLVLRLSGDGDKVKFKSDVAFEEITFIQTTDDVFA